MKILSSWRLRAIVALILVILYGIAVYYANKRTDAPSAYNDVCNLFAELDNDYVCDVLCETDQYLDFIEAENRYLRDNDTVGLYDACMNLIFIIRHDTANED